MGFSPSVAALGLASPYDGAIQEAAGGDQQLIWLIKAVISRESAWNPGALRPEYRQGQFWDASYGLMQILLRTARLYDATVQPGDLFIPAVNIQIGGAYLRDQVARYGLEGGISAYNAGAPTAANAAYVADVLTYYTFFLNNEPAVDVTAPTADAAGGQDERTSGVMPLAGIGVAAGMLLLLAAVARR